MRWLEFCSANTPCTRSDLEMRTPSKRKLFCITYSTDGESETRRAGRHLAQRVPGGTFPVGRDQQSTTQNEFHELRARDDCGHVYGFTAFRYENFVTRTETVLCIVRMSSTSAWRQAPLRSQLERRLLHPSRLPVLLQVSASFDPPTLVR